MHFREDGGALKDCFKDAGNSVLELWSWSRAARKVLCSESTGYDHNRITQQPLTKHPTNKILKSPVIWIALVPDC